jgi:hypothetical protein
MLTYGITVAAVGVTLETNGVITGITCATPPPPGPYEPPLLDPTSGISTRRNLTLIDGSGPGVRPRQIVNFDPYSQPLHPNMALMTSSNGIPFGALTVGSVPPGSQWTVTTA